MVLVNSQTTKAQSEYPLRDRKKTKLPVLIHNWELVCFVRTFGPNAVSSFCSLYGRYGDWFGFEDGLAGCTLAGSSGCLWYSLEGCFYS